jgi:outer membrane protein TolC
MTFSETWGHRNVSRPESASSTTIRGGTRNGVPIFRGLVAAFGMALPLCAQFGAPAANGSATRVQQVPLSGRAQGSSVSIGQSTAGGAGTGSVNTLNSTLQVQGNVQGSIPGNDAVTKEPLTLTLAQAIERGLKSNLSAVVSNTSQRDANAQTRGARAQMLPDLNADVREVAQQTDLAAAGLRFSSFPLGPGESFKFPTIVGPFNYFDVRASVSQSVADLTRLHNYRSSKESARATAITVIESRELIVLAVTGAYLQVITGQNRMETARAQLDTAEAAYALAVDRNKSGLNARIDVNRSQVEMQTQRQRLNSLLNDLAKQRIAFARLIGLPQSQPVSLTDRDPFKPTDAVADVNEMIKLAWDQRPEVRAATVQVRAAEEARKAATSEYLPSLTLNADYGVIGVNPSQSHGTFTVSGALHVPIYRSGRTAADVEQANAALAQRRAELEDIRGVVEQDVRNAQLDVDTASEQIRLAESNRRLAADTVEQARDRFNAGLADTLELVQAQESAATAEQDYISAMFSYQLARAGLARAVGGAEKSIH